MGLAFSKRLNCCVYSFLNSILFVKLFFLLFGKQYQFHCYCYCCFCFYNYITISIFTCCWAKFSLFWYIIFFDFIHFVLSFLPPHHAATIFFRRSSKGYVTTSKKCSFMETHKNNLFSPKVWGCHICSADFLKRFNVLFCFFFSIFSGGNCFLNVLLKLWLF